MRDSDSAVKEESKTAGAPDEIEVTPAMVEAGIDFLSPRVIVDLRDGWIRPSVVAAGVFRAMLRASR
jgi:hypothetical protein